MFICDKIITHQAWRLCQLNKSPFGKYICIDEFHDEYEYVYLYNAETQEIEALGFHSYRTNSRYLPSTAQDVVWQFDRRIKSGTIAKTHTTFDGRHHRRISRRRLLRCIAKLIESV